MISKFNAELRINPESHDLSVNSPLVIDVEDDEKDGFVGIGLTQDGQTIYYYTSLQPIQELLEQCQLIGHNIKYDMHQLRKWKVRVLGGQILDDTYLAAHTIDSINSNGLKPLAQKYLGMEWVEYDTLVTGKGKAKQTLDTHPIEVVANYCGCDVLATWRLKEKFKEIMRPDEDFYYRTDIDLLQAIFNMEMRGVRIDKEYLQRIEKEHLEKVEHTGEWFTKQGVNPNSPAQVLPWLNKQGVEVTSTNEDALLEFKKFDVVQKLLEYRGIKKLTSTYITAPLKQIKQERLHGKFNLAGTWTGRLSASAPNLQNQPRGPIIRTAFIPDNGELWYKFDYSQLELRVLADLSADEAIIEAFNSGADLHSFTAHKLYKTPLEQVTPDQRQKAKAINFGIAYGKTSYGLAAELQIPNEEAEGIINGWWSSYIRASAYRTRLIWNARRKGYITTIFGIRRRIKGIEEWCSCGKKFCKACWRSKAMSRELMSAMIAGSAADIVKKAMADVVRAGYIPLLQVHDELDFSLGPKSPRPEKIKAIMEDAVKLKVPLLVEMKSGKNWGECG
jgi:DNA polymerase-1